MLIEITQLNNHYFQWKLYDGPDGVDVRRGSTPTIEMAFERILEARKDISASYTEAEPAPTPIDYTTYPNGTVFKLRNGDTATKSGLNRSFRYPVLGHHQGSVRSWTADGRFSSDGHQDGLDIVGILWKPEAETPADPDEQLETQDEPTSPEPGDYSTYPNGTIFHLRNGDTATKTGTATSGIYTVQANHNFRKADNLYHSRTWTPGGRYIITDSEHPFDIVGIAFNPEANIPATSDGTLQQLETQDEPTSPESVDYTTYPNSTIFRLRNGGTAVQRAIDLSMAFPIHAIHNCVAHQWTAQGQSSLGSARDIIGVLWTPDSGIPVESLLEPDNQTLQQLETQEEPQQPADDPWLSPETIHTIKEEFYRTGPHPEYADADTSPEDAPTFAYPERDPNLRCQTCRWFVPLRSDSGCCKRRAPSPDGFPVLSMQDWCGEHLFHEPS